jgi:hypothetical protein
MRRIASTPIAGLVAALLASVAVSASTAQQQQTAIPDAAVEALALQWFGDMQSGRIDRSRLTPEYNAHLSDAAVEGLAEYMKAHAYGAAPLRAEIVVKRKAGDQSIYIVKLVFPRGDAASLIIGLNGAGQITGLDVTSMAGD